MRLKIIEQHKSHGGLQIKYRHYAETLQTEATFSLYLPEAATAATPTALIWWLAGLTCTDDNFSQKGAFQKYAAQQNLAFVMPDTSPRGVDVADSEDWDLGQGAGFYLNATETPWQAHFHMYDYLTKELPAIVYDLIPHFSGQESIMGHSMGGHGALILGLKNPARFKAISAFAPISHPSVVPWGKKAFTAYLGEDQTKWQAWDATALVANVDGPPPPILITQGTADDFYDTQLVETDFLTAAKEAGASVRYESETGYDHSYFTIASFIERHIAFHQHYFS